MPNPRIRQRFLPHWESHRAVYFVTFRLADSLPRAILESLRRVHDGSASLPRTAAGAGTARMAVLPSKHPVSSLVAPPSRRSVQSARQKLIEENLDRGAGACYLRRPEIAELVAQALRKFDDERYRLLSWCVMPNHVHVVFQPWAPFALQHILHSWKSYSALQANALLKRTGRFWQREYYDHLIRDGAELGRAVRYTVENPIKARLRDWRWTYVAQDWS